MRGKIWRFHYPKIYTRWPGFSPHAHYRGSPDDPGWKYNVGVVPPITDPAAPPGRDDAYAIPCNPPIMITFTPSVLEKLGYTCDQIIMSYEKRKIWG